MEQAQGLEIRELTDLADLHALADLFTAIWGAPEPLVNGDLLRAMSKAGSYVGGAFVDGRLVGGCIGFHEAPETRTLHSHIAGVLPAYVGRSIGLALKLHQRDWALARGISTIEWTYDQLVARNAHFNIVKLGARPVEYLTNFYGPMDDAINGVDESDRILIRWQLDRVAPPGEESEETVWVATPTDIESLRMTDALAAARWRKQLRDELAPLMETGWQVVGFDRANGYLLAPPAGKDVHR
jgi:predicted GNAT superfamily acetyltransferase